MKSSKTNRPYVICHMVTSVDGKIQTKNWPGLSSTYGLYEKCHESFKGDAWIVGRTTMEGFSSSKRRAAGKPDPSLKKVDFVGDAKAKSFAIVIDGSGKCYWDKNSITGDHVIEILTEKVSTTYLGQLREKKVSYIFAGKSEIDLSVALNKLRKLFGIERLLLEGGGVVNGSFLKKGLIDELSQLIVPVADGSIGTPTLFDVEQGYTKRKAAKLKLTKLKKLAGDVLWLRYQFLK